MTANQVKEIVQKTLNQARGEEAVELVTMADVLSLGETMFVEGWANDFFGALLDVIGKTTVINRPYSPRTKSKLKDAFEYGAILRKIDVEPLPVDYDRAWTKDTDETDTIGGTNDGYLGGIFKIKKPTVRQVLFNSFNVWAFEMTIPNKQVKQAFHSAEELAAFIDALMVAMQNSINESIDAMNRMTLSTFAAIKCAETFGTGATATTAINLLSDYNELHPDATLTAAEAMENLDFMRYACKQILLFQKRMEEMSELFNGEKRKRFTPKENQVLTLNSDFVAAYETYLMSTTFHEELVKLGEYDEVNYWQGSGLDYSDHEKIAVTTPAFSIGEGTADNWSVSADGVIGILADDRAYGVTIYDRDSASVVDTIKGITQMKESANIGWFNDRAENGIVFIVADEDPTIAGSSEVVTPPADGESKKRKA